MFDTFRVVTERRYVGEVYSVILKDQEDLLRYRLDFINLLSDGSAVMECTELTDSSATNFIVISATSNAFLYGKLMEASGIVLPQPPVV